MVTETLIRQIEQFLYRECELLDDWRLMEWADLFVEEGRYTIPPLKKPDVDSSEVLYYVDDNKFRLTERAKRLLKKEAHVEFPHSTTCHTLSNIIIKEIKDDVIHVRCNFVTYRTKREMMDYFVGHHLYKITKDSQDNLKILEKKVVLTHDAIRPQGKISIIL